MNAKQAKLIPLVDLLEKLGHYPETSRKSGTQIFFKSPFRPDETKASFIVNLHENTWHDFGNGNHGSTIDLVMKLSGISVKETLSELDNIMKGCSTISFLPSPIKFDPSSKSKDVSYQIKKDIPLNSTILENYLRDTRKLDLDIVRPYVREIQYYSVTRKRMYFGIGFRNSLGFYEFRNAGMKGCLGKKSYTFIEGDDSERIDIFEGFTNFLSKLTLDQITGDRPTRDTLILNSLSMYKRASEFLIERGRYEEGFLWLDNDTSGHTATLEYTGSDSLFPISHFITMNHHYEPYNDLNEWLKEHPNAKAPWI